ncbi:hypothetical protein INR49_022507 [Caranx melampygus]|nr:hypothetical protein INR49_022507 [Caranx melampygus]
MHLFTNHFTIETTLPTCPLAEQCTYQYLDNDNPWTSSDGTNAAGQEVNSPTTTGSTFMAFLSRLLILALFLR